MPEGDAPGAQTMRQHTPVHVILPMWAREGLGTGGLLERVTTQVP